MACRQREARRIIAQLWETPNAGKINPQSEADSSRATKTRQVDALRTARAVTETAARAQEGGEIGIRQPLLARRCRLRMRSPRRECGEERTRLNDALTAQVVTRKRRF